MRCEVIPAPGTSPLSCPEQVHFFRPAFWTLDLSHSPLVFWLRGWWLKYSYTHIYSLSSETGTEIWTFNTGNEVISSPSFANGVVYIAAIGRLYALNADTGIQIWNFSCGGGTTSSPAIANGLIYVGSQDTCLYAIGKISYSNPTIVTISPSSITAGSDAFTLEVTGTNFVDGAKVLWEGQERATVFISTTKLTTTILQGDVANAGTYSVTVAVSYTHLTLPTIYSV